MQTVRKLSSLEFSDRFKSRLSADNTSDLVDIVGETRDLIYTSSNHETPLGFNPANDKLGLLRAIHPDDLTRFQKTYLSVILTGDAQTFEFRLRHAESPSVGRIGHTLV